MTPSLVEIWILKEWNRASCVQIEFQVILITLFSPQDERYTTGINVRVIGRQ